MIFRFARNGKDVVTLELFYSIFSIIVQTFTTRSQLQLVHPPTLLSLASAFLCYQKSECLKYTIELPTKSFAWLEIGGILTLLSVSVADRNAKAALNRLSIF